MSVLEEFIKEQNPVSDCALNLRARAFSDHAAALGALREFAGDEVDGWCCYPSEVVRVRSAADLRLDAPPLSAELVRGDKTLSLRYVGPGYVGAEATESVGDSHTARTHTLRAVMPGDARGGHNVIYKTYWAKQIDSDPTRPVGPVATRLCGFEEEDR